MNELSEKDLSLIQKYLGDALSPSDKSMFEEKIKQPAFNKELLFQAQLVDSLEEIDNATVRQELAELKGKSKEKATTSNFSNLIKIIGVAAILALAWIAYQSMQHSSPSPTQLAESYGYVYPPSEIQRGQADSTNSISEAMKAYADKNYAHATTLFNKSQTKSEQAYMYLANCYIQTKKYNKAEKVLKNLVLSEDVELKQNAEWYLTICHLAQSDLNNTNAQLGKIIENKNHLFFENARRLQKDINS